MKQSMRKLVAVMGLFLVAAIAAGCSSRGSDLVGSGQVSLENVDSKGVHIAWRKVQQDGEYLVVSGVLRRHALTSYPIWRQVEVTVLAPDGTVLQEARTSDIQVPRRVPGRGFNTKRFEVRLPGIPPRGSVVHVSLL